MMKLVRLTKENANNYLGYQIIYKSRHEYKINIIDKIINSGIKIKNIDLNNTLVFSREIYVII